MSELLDQLVAHTKTDCRGNFLLNQQGSLQCSVCGAVAWWDIPGIGLDIPEALLKANEEAECRAAVFTKTVRDSYDPDMLTECTITESGTPVHVFRGVAIVQCRCLCGERLADIVNGKLAMHDVSSN